MDADRRGALLALAGAVLLVVTLVGSAVVAPRLAVAGADDHRRTLVGVQGGGPGWHEFGSVALVDGSRVAWREGSADSYFDVTATDEGVLAGFMHGGYADCGPYDAPCTHTGFRVIDPSGPTVVDEFGFPVRTRKNSEVHDVEPLASGGFLVSDMEHERIVVVRNGTVTWQWNASNLYDAPADPTRTDWLHINDVDVIREGRYLVSVRNANQLVVVERGEGAVEIVNADRTDADDGVCRGDGALRDTDGDGDVRCGDPDVLDAQHNPQWLGDGAVLVADSHNDRVVELHRRDGRWEPAWTLERAGGVGLTWPRDADRLPGGHTLVTDTLNRRIIEVDESGNVVWGVRTEYIPYEADRLPVGEPVGGPQLEGSPDGSPGGKVPLLSPALVGLRAVVPKLPFWFKEPQLGLTLVSVALVVVGAVDRFG